MGRAQAPRPKDKETQRLLERIELAKAWEEDDARRWREASDAERARAFGDLAGLAEAIVRSRGFPLDREPLAFPRFDREPQ